MLLLTIENNTRWFPINVFFTCVSSLISSFDSNSFPFQLYFILSGTKEGQIYPSFGECAGAVSISDACFSLCVCLCQERYFNISKCLTHDHWSICVDREHWLLNHVLILTCFPSHFTLQENADAFSSAAHLYEDCSVLIATVKSNPRYWWCWCW